MNIMPVRCSCHAHADCDTYAAFAALLLVHTSRLESFQSTTINRKVLISVWWCRPSQMGHQGQGPREADELAADESPAGCLHAAIAPCHYTKPMDSVWLTRGVTHRATFSKDGTMQSMIGGHSSFVAPCKHQGDFACSLLIANIHA